MSRAREKGYFTKKYMIFAIIKINAYKGDIC